MHISVLRHRSCEKDCQTNLNILCVATTPMMKGIVTYCKHVPML